MKDRGNSRSSRERKGWLKNVASSKRNWRPRRKPGSGGASNGPAGTRSRSRSATGRTSGFSREPRTSASKRRFAGRIT